MFRKLNFMLGSFKDLNLSPRATRTIQAYILSKRNDSTTRETGTIGVNDTIELYDTIKDFTGVEFDFYKDEDGNLMLEEITENGSRMIEFQEAEYVADYLEHLTYLGIQGKINNKKINIVRDDESAEDKDIDFRDGKREVTLFKQNEYELKDENGIIIENPSTESLKRNVGESFSNMSINELNRFSKFEYKKMIAGKYADITLTEEEIEALDFYKGSRIF